MTRIKKYQDGTSETKGVPFSERFEKFMGKHGGKITSAATALAPLLMKQPDPNERPYKKGTKLIKYEGGNSEVYVKGDSIKYRTSQGDVASGATFEEMPKPGAKKTNTAPVTTTKTSPKEESKFQSLGEGGWGREKEAASVGIMSAIGEMFPEKSKLGGIGNVLKNTLKYGPTAVRSVYDLVFEAAQKGVDNINWKERLGNLLQDASAATTGSGLIRFGKSTTKNIQKQITTAASKNPEKDVIEPINFKKAAAQGAMEAAEKSSIISRPVKFAKYVSNMTEKGKKASENIKTYQQKVKTAKELEAANTAATNLALQKKHTGPANAKKGIGVEGTYYVKGEPTTKEKYDAYIAEVGSKKQLNAELKKSKEYREAGATSYTFQATPAPGMSEIAGKRKQVSEELNSINQEMKAVLGDKKNISDLNPEDLKKYQELENKKKPLITYISQTTEKIKTETPGKTGAENRKKEEAATALAKKKAAEAEAAAKKAAERKSKNEESLKKAREAREAKANKEKKAAEKKAAENKKDSGKKINFKGQSSSSSSSSKTSNKTSSKKQSSAVEDEPTEEAIMGMAAQYGLGRGKKK